MRSALRLLPFAFALASTHVLAADPPREPAEPQEIAKARTLVERLVEQDYDNAGKDFDDTMRKALPPDKLKAGWQSVTEQFGKLQKLGSPRVEKADPYIVVFLPCMFEKATISVKLVFTKEGQVTGLFFVPAQDYKAPDYVTPKSFRQVAVTIGSEEWALPGTLNVPDGEGPFPAIILVHGSGPQDRDESIGANKPFRDLAGGLATRGVAVLSYEKRTLVHAKKLSKDVTVKEEVTDDVLAAAELLRGRKEINAKKIFVLGHSLGAMMAPRIAEADKTLAGIILMAGPARALEDLMLEQITYLFSLRGEPTAEKKAELAEVKKQVERIKDPQLPPDTPTEQLLGAPASYWLSLRGYQPITVAKRLKLPILILQGERDYQVTMEDFGLWQKQLSGRKNVEFKSYTKLNHLMIPGEGKSAPDELFRAGHVAVEVVEDIAAWVKKQ
jgi:fermentation-respiration switch protein FrsA (DUF1100 family)